MSHRGGGGSEKCQKIVTYYLYGPLDKRTKKDILICKKNCYDDDIFQELPDVFVGTEALRNICELQGFSTFFFSVPVPLDIKKNKIH